MQLRMIRWSEESIKLFDDASLLMKVYSPFILWLLRSVPNPPESICQALDDPKLLSPKLEKKHMFNYDPKINKPVGEHSRYMFNMPSTYLYDDDAIPPEFLADVKYNAELFKRYAYQSRWGTFYQQIFASLVYKDQDTEAFALKNTNYLDLSQHVRYGKDLLTLQTIAYMFKRFLNLPFVVNARDQLVVNKYEPEVWSTCMVPLTYSLLELSKEEKGHNVRPDVLQLIILNRIKAAYTSFETEMLTRKSIYTDAMKIITSNLGKHVKVEHRVGGPYPSCHTLESKEILLTETEIEDLSRKTKQLAPEYFQWLQSNFRYLKTPDPFKNTEHARYLLMVANIFGNPGIYYKTSLMLEAVASIEPQLQSVLNLPKPKTFLVVDESRLVQEYDWETGDEVWKAVRDEYLRRLHDVEDVWTRDDFMEYFVTLLTNKSQGDKVELTMYDPSLMDEKSDRANIILSVRQARVAAFTFDISTYFSYNEFVSKLRDAGVCTIRFQNNRRARIVEIVPNLDQTAYAIILRVFNEIKKKYSGVAVGKQTGGINDMFLQLSITGNPLGVSAFSDVTGMDASTQPFIATMFGQIIAEHLVEIFPQGGNPQKRYFAFNDVEFQIDSVDDPRLRTKIIPALAHALYLILRERMQKKYFLTDPIFKTKIQVNPNIFESGRFDTSAQHTVFLDIIADIVIKRLKYLLSIRPALIEKRRFGDDAYAGLIFACEKDLFEYMLQFVKLEQELLLRAGFQLENAISRHIGDFLQQLAFNGACVPKSARSSVMTDERSQTRVRDRLAMIKVVSDVMISASQRCYSMNNVITITYAAWLATRSIQIFEQASALLTAGIWTSAVVKLGKRFYFTYSWLCPFISPHNYPHPRIQIGSGALEETSNLCLVGDSGIVWFMNSSCTEYEQERACTTFSEHFDGAEEIWKGFYFQNCSSLFLQKIQHPYWKQAFVLNMFNRSALLSKKRQTLLQFDIQKMAGVLSSFYDQTKMSLSYEGWIRLRTVHSIKMPESLAYWAQPTSKIETMFSALVESELEAREMDEDFVKYLLRYKQTVPKSLIQKVQRLTIFFEDAGDTLTDAWPSFPKFPILPGSFELSDHDNYTKRAGTPFIRSGKISKLFSPLLSKYGQKFDLERAIQIGHEALHKGDGAFSDFMLAINLPEELKTTFRTLVAEDALLLGGEFYNTGFRPQVMFDINGDVDRLYPDIEIEGVSSASSIRAMHIVARDFIMTRIHHKPVSRVKVRPSYQARIYLERRKIANMLGIRVG